MVETCCHVEGVCGHGVLLHRVSLGRTSFVRSQHLATQIIPMLILPFLYFVSFTVYCVAVKVSHARLLPERMVTGGSATRTNLAMQSGVLFEMAAQDTTGPKSVLVLKTPWIKEFVAYTSGQGMAGAKVVGPLRSKFTNYDDTLANENDLRSWTRYIVNSGHDEEVSEHSSASPKVLDLDVEKFIRYLVVQRGFKEEDLSFLRQPGLNHGYDEIENELSKLRESNEGARTIDIGGEQNVGQRLSLSATFIFIAIASIL